MIIRLLFCLVCSTALTGCEIIRGIGSARVVKDEVAFVFDASERLVYTYNDVTCSEPPPDVLVNTIEKTDLGAELQTPTGKGVSAELKYEFNESAEKIFERSQSIQSFRDKAHFLCQSLANGAIDESQFTERFDLIVNQAQFSLGSSQCNGNDKTAALCYEALDKVLE